MPCGRDDPDSVTCDHRRHELAAILARGMLRLLCMRQVEPAPVPADLQEFAESRLKARTPPRRHVTGRPS